MSAPHHGANAKLPTIEVDFAGTPEKVIPELEAAIREREGLLRARQAELVSLEMLIRERDAAISDREELILARTREAQVLEEVVREREAAIQEREETLRQRLAEAPPAVSGDRLIPISNGAIAAKLRFGGYAVVPAWNLDVGLAMIKDGIIEPWTSRAVEAVLKPGQTFLNVGANLGYYMTLGAHCVGRTGKVFAVEANRNLLPFLMRSVYWSGYPDVIRLFNCAVTDVDDLIIELRCDPQYVGGGSVIDPESVHAPSPGAQARRQSASAYGTDLGHPPILTGARNTTLERGQLEDALWEHADISGLFREDGEWHKNTGIFVKVKCQTKRLDTILADVPAVDLLLMDIEGSEPPAILGARELIQRSPHLSIIMEWSPHFCLSEANRAQTDAMVDYLVGLGFSFYRVRHEGFQADQPVPSLTPLPDRAALYETPHNDVLCTRNLEQAYEGWSNYFLPESAIAGR